MIIDFHTHTFPGELAAQTLHALSMTGGTRYYTEGTVPALRASMRSAGISFSMVMPVATKPKQSPFLLKQSIQSLSNYKETGVLFFGGIHPGNDDYKELLTEYKAQGGFGIKLHPYFQRTYIDDPAYLRLIDHAANLGLIILIHAGDDISYPGITWSSVEHLENMYNHVPYHRIVLAHGGGWNRWNEVEERLADKDLYIDTSFSMQPVIPPAEFTYPVEGKAPDIKELPKIDQEYVDTLISDSSMIVNREALVASLLRYPPLRAEQLNRIVSKLGEDKVLFATDSPWTDQKDAIADLRSAIPDLSIQKKILGGNAQRLLKEVGIDLV